MQQVLSAIERQFGRVVSRASAIPPIPRISSGVFAVDLATGGGFPVGRISLLYGKRSSGKSDLALRAVSEFQKLCHGCYQPTPCTCVQPVVKQTVWADLEGTFPRIERDAEGHVLNPTEMLPAGRFVNGESLYVSQTTLGEEAVDIVDALAKTPDVGLIVLDSLAGLVPIKEYEESASDKFMGLQPRLVGTLLRKLISTIAQRRKDGDRLTVILINQIRSKMVMMGSPEVLPGGFAPEFFASVILKLWQKPYVEEKKISDKPLFACSAFSVQKNKVCLGSLDGEYRISTQDASGVPAGKPDDTEIVITYARRYGVIRKDGGWKFESHTWKNLEQIAQAVNSDPTLFQSLRTQTLQRSIHGVHSNGAEG